MPGPRYIEALESAFHLRIAAGRAGALVVRGRIDRIDRAGNDVLVVDYKTGPAPHTKETERGRNYQMPVYILAARERFPGAQVRGDYWVAASEAKSDGRVSPNRSTALIASSLHILGEQVSAARAGDFSTHANGREADEACSRHCDYAQLCRASILHAGKAAPTAVQAGQARTPSAAPESEDAP